MKWPKSEEKIEIGWGALEKLGGPPDGVPLPSQMSGCATGQTDQGPSIRYRNTRFHRRCYKMAGTGIK